VPTHALRRAFARVHVCESSLLNLVVSFIKFCFLFDWVKFCYVLVNFLKLDYKLVFYFGLNLGVLGACNEL
jgi:hypothetical protein